MSGPCFPSLVPKVADQLWFSVDQPCDDENELTNLEEEHQNWLKSLVDKGKTIIPVGKSAAENMADEEEEEDDDGDDETDTNDDDDELGTEVIGDRDSPDEFDMEGNNGNGSSPAWEM